MPASMPDRTVLSTSSASNPTVIAACRKRGYKIGSTSGYLPGMLAINQADAKKQGYVPDYTCGAGESSFTVDPYGSLRGSLRSTSEFYVRNARLPHILGSIGKEGDGASRLHFVADPLIGVKALTLGNSAFSLQERPDLILEGKISGISRKELEEAQREGLSRLESTCDRVYLRRLYGLFEGHVRQYRREPLGEHRLA